MNAIRILTEKVASQIAAGEVIERPASVVRELIDNSIDAEANKIFLKIQKGGKTLIRVSDNGIGMGKDDLLLCLERHATSKILSVSDLQSISTMGFRGEALASISSVSKLSVTTRPSDQLVGHRLKTSGGRFVSIEETGAAEGTVTEVRDLFYNIPARKKFLRTIKTETDHIVETLSRISIPFINIHFRLDDERKTVLNLPGSDNVVNRLSVLLGRHFAANLIEGEQETDSSAIRAFMGSPNNSRSQSDHVFLYVNGRHFRDRMLTRAVMEGYGQRLMKGRYPQIVVFIEIDPSLIDMNVHPTKQEIRFHDGKSIFNALVSTIDTALGNQFKPLYAAGIKSNYSDERVLEKFTRDQIKVAEPGLHYSLNVPDTSPQLEPFSEEDQINKGEARVIGQLKNTYILCQTGDGLLILDQHAAHERIVYEKLKGAYRNSKLERQSFLIPERLELSLKEAQILLKNIDKFAELGIEVEHFGGNTFLLKSIPSILVNVRMEEFIPELIPIMEEESLITADKALNKILSIMACHGAIRAGQSLTEKEMNVLIDQLEKSVLPTNCPHGRPIFKKIVYRDLEKMFKRVI